MYPSSSWHRASPSRGRESIRPSAWSTSTRHCSIWPVCRRCPDLDGQSLTGRRCSTRITRSKRRISNVWRHAGHYLRRPTVPHPLAIPRAPRPSPVCARRPAGSTITGTTLGARTCPTRSPCQSISTNTATARVARARFSIPVGTGAEDPRQSVFRRVLRDAWPCPQPKIRNGRIWLVSTGDR